MYSEVNPNIAAIGLGVSMIVISTIIESYFAPTFRRPINRKVMYQIRYALIIVAGLVLIVMGAYGLFLKK